MGGSSFCRVVRSGGGGGGGGWGKKGTKRETKKEV